MKGVNCLENKRKYSWKYGNRFDPNMVGAQFEAIEKRDGTLTKTAIVDAARSEDNPMHDMFEWDDAVAGELYRENQAGYYIRTLEVQLVPVGNPNGKPIDMRAYVNVEPVNTKAPERKGTYMNVHAAVEQPDTYKIVLDRAKNQLRIFRDQYKNIKELEPVITAIDKVV
jgi:hypothetical protein